MYETRGKNYSGQQILQKINTTIRVTVGHMYTTLVTHIHPKKARGQMWDTWRRPRKENQWGGLKITRRAYGEKDEREAGETLKNIV